MLSRVLALTFALTLWATAQRVGSGSIPGSRGIQTVSVRIATDNGQPLNFPVRVQLTNDSGTPISEVFAHNGMVDFPVREGNYRLRVTGAEIQDVTTESFSVSGAVGTPMQFVRVKLREQPNSAGSAQGTISTSELNAPDKARSEFRKGNDEIAHQQWKKAVSHLQKAIDVYPQYASAYNSLGVAYIKIGDAAGARQAFEQAVKLNEHTGMAYLNLARMSLMARNYPETIRLSGRALALNPNEAEALVMMANSELAIGQYDSAVLHARKVHELPHQHLALAHVIAATALEGQHKPAEAAAEYELFLREDPNSPRAPGVRQALMRVSAQAQPTAAGPNPRP
jgi:Tfp pilus assembly protein PilF